MHKLKVISSTTRPGRKGPALTAWLAAIARQHPEFEVEVLDLAEINLPMMNEPFHPKLQKYQHEHTRQWSATIAEADAFVMVTAEYNSGIPAPLKNALDYLGKEWAHKPVAIVSYGGVSAGTRSAQMLKSVLATLKMVPLVETVAIPFFDQFINGQGVFVPNPISEKAAHDMVAELFRWATALKPLRSPSPATQPAGAAPVVA
ncbi:MAG: NAD(P)H-dependent oxidoreductase [Cytophagales bacterium]|nr:NAD(P)H-dependent oxidoreductase [Cytophagales bacterium]